METIKWYLTKDSTMDYSIFVGTEKPKIRKDPGKIRYRGNSKCRLVLFFGLPGNFEN